MAKEVKFHSEGIGLVPTSADPSNPAQGQLQYSDGTARAEGLWKYDGTSWTRLGGSGGIISDWIDFTPTGTWTTNTTYNGKYRRVGSVAEIRYELDLSGAPNSATLELDAPAGLSVDANELLYNTDQASVGFGQALDSGSNRKDLRVQYRDPQDKFVVQAKVASATYSTLAGVTELVPQTFAAGDEITVTVSVPIVGWSTGVLPNEISEGTPRITSLTNNTPFNITDNVFTKLPFTSGDVVTDTTAMYNSGLDRIDILESGYYDIVTSMSMADSPFASRNLICRARKNGTTSVTSDAEQSLAGNTSTVKSVDLAVWLDLGDYIELEGYQNEPGGTTAEDTTLYSITLAKRNDLRSQITPAETVAASYRTDAGQQVNFNALTTVLYEDKRYDTHNAYNTSTGIYTAPVAGKYLIKAVARVTGLNPTLASSLHMDINLNGALNSRGYPISVAEPGEAPQIPVSDVLDLVAGDEIEIQFFHNNGTNRFLLTDSRDNYFSITKIGN